MTKYEKISVLAKETARSIGENKESWMNYLDVASRLYKYPFEDQILIYAQRPDATACAPLEMWNEKMFCWVNRGAKGIALIDQESDYPRLRYVFDVSDVHKARRIGKLEKNMKKVFLPHWKGYMELPIRTHRLKTGFIRFPKE